MLLLLVQALFELPASGVLVLQAVVKHSEGIEGVPMLGLLAPGELLELFGNLTLLSLNVGKDGLEKGK